MSFHTARRCSTPSMPWQTDGLWERINFVLLPQARERAGREASPSGGVIDSPSVKTTESGGPRGYGRWQEGQRAQAPHHHRHQRAPGRRPGARRRHPGSRRRGRRAGFDPRSLPLAAPRLRRWRLCWRKAGDEARRDGAVDACHRQATRSGQATGFCLLPRRWVVERTVAWLGPQPVRL